MDNVKLHGELRKIFVSKFSGSELHTLCSDLGTDYDELPGSTKSDKARELVEHCARRDQVLDLIEAGRQSRPDVSWENVLQMAQQAVDGSSPRGDKGVQCNPETMYYCMSWDYGVGYDEIKILCTIASNGSAKVRREVQVKAHSAISELDTFLLSPESTSPSPDDRDFGVIAANSMTQGKDVCVVRSKDKPGSHSGVVKISPPLNKGEEFTYELLEKVPPGQYAIDLSEDELKKLETPYDYLGWSINRPTKKLLLEVRFPHGMRPEVYDREVRFASASPGLPAERRQYEQEKRLRKPHRFAPDPEYWELRLEVNYPMIGLIYMVRWQPVPKAVEKRAESAK